jgi:nuclear receptor interaction protein
MLAVSGIDSTVKIFSPDHRARQAAAGANGITAADTSTFTSIWRQPRRPRPSVTAMSSSQQLTPQEQLQKELSDEMILDASGDVSDAEEPPVADKGLESRKRLNLQYQITSENDMERRSGMHSSYVSRSMLQLLMTSQIRAHLANGEEGDGECIVM